MRSPNPNFFWNGRKIFRPKSLMMNVSKASLGNSRASRFSTANSRSICEYCYFRSCLSDAAFVTADRSRLFTRKDHRPDVLHGDTSIVARSAHDRVALSRERTIAGDVSFPPGTAVARARATPRAREGGWPEINPHVSRGLAVGETFRGRPPPVRRERGAGQPKVRRCVRNSRQRP